MGNFDSIYLQLKKSYERNLPEFLAYRKRLYPDFVFDRQARPLKNEIPVFTFHSVEPIRFERQLQFLATNNYRTLSADEFYRIIIQKQPIPEKAIVLTFDDGLGSLWSVGYPLLKKYGFTAVCFIVPGCTVYVKNYFPNLYDHWNGKASLQEVLCRELTSIPFCTWQEIETMHQSGVVDFQSHTMYHNLEFTSSTIVDYIHPTFPTWYHNFRVPLFSVDGIDNIERKAELGTPIYSFKPRMAGERRYF
ncbi:MAG: polysaccharide deacetylase family protein, partial [Candidatus Hodarchaeota archaeon]